MVDVFKLEIGSLVYNNSIGTFVWNRDYTRVVARLESFSPMIFVGDPAAVPQVQPVPAPDVIYVSVITCNGIGRIVAHALTQEYSPTFG